MTFLYADDLQELTKEIHKPFHAIIMIHPGPRQSETWQVQSDDLILF